MTIEESPLAGIRRRWFLALGFVAGAVLPLSLLRGQTRAHPTKTDLPYHQAPPKEPPPATMDPRKFADPAVRRCYLLAAKIKSVLYQLPCFCACGEAEGHQSLLDCYITDHAAKCDACQLETIYAYGESARGKRVAEIRKGVLAGEWVKVSRVVPAEPKRQ